MQEIMRGQRLKLADLLDPAARFQITVQIAGKFELDIACFGIDTAGKLVNDDHMVFFNQLATPCGGVRLAISNGAGTFDLNLALLPAKVDRLVFTATIDGSETMREIGAGSVTILQNQAAKGAYSFTGADFGAERALLLTELYRKDGGWRYTSLGQGFNGGLAALLRHFGGEVSEDPKPVPALATPAPAPVPPVSLSKVTLTKPEQSHTVQLTKNPGKSPNKILIRAQWVDNGDSRSDNDDLDLRVGLLLPDGKFVLIHAPANSGALNASPWVLHTGDVRSASAKSPGVETVEINPEIAKHYGGTVALVFSVYSAVTNGVVSVASLKPIMRMEYGDQVVDCAYDFAKSKSFGVYTYVIGTALISESSVRLKPSGETSKRFSEATPRLAWSPKSDEPVMTVNGPAVFKHL